MKDEILTNHNNQPFYQSMSTSKCRFVAYNGPEGTLFMQKNEKKAFMAAPNQHGDNFFYAVDDYIHRLIHQAYEEVSNEAHVRIGYAKVKGPVLQKLLATPVGAAYQKHGDCSHLNSAGSFSDHLVKGLQRLSDNETGDKETGQSGKKTTANIGCDFFSESPAEYTRTAMPTPEETIVVTHVYGKGCQDPDTNEGFSLSNTMTTNEESI